MDFTLGWSVEDENGLGIHQSRLPPSKLNYARQTENAPMEYFKDSFQVVQALSYTSALSTKPKPPRTSHNALHKTEGEWMDKKGTRSPRKFFPNSQNSNTTAVASPKYETAESKNENPDFLLLGRSVRDSGWCSRGKNERNIENEGSDFPRQIPWPEGPRDSHLPSALRTYPPAAKTHHHYRAQKRFNHESGPPLFQAFNPRALGEPSANFTHRQRWRSRETSSPLRSRHERKSDGLIAYGRQALLSHRRSPTADRSSCGADLRRTSSSSSLLKNNKMARFRSLSLPTQTKVESCAVVDLREKRSNDVTYVTPLFKSLSNESGCFSLSSSDEQEYEEKDTKDVAKSDSPPSVA